MTKQEFRLKLILELSNGVAIKNGVNVDKVFNEAASAGIVATANAITDRVFAETVKED